MTDPAFGLSEENIDAVLRQRLEAAGLGVVDPGEGTVEEPAAPPATESLPSAPEAPQVLTLPDGRTIDLEAAQRFVAFEDEVISDPRFQQAYRSYLEGAGDATQVPAHVPAAPPAPDGTGIPPDLADALAVDPALRYLYEQNQALQARLDGVAQSTEALSSGFTTIEQRNAMGLVNQARANFMREKGLNQSDMDRIYQTTLDVYDLDKLVSLPMNPVTRQAETPDPVRRLEDAFDWAYHSIPEFREREYAAREEATKAETERKAKLTALSTSGSSAPPPTPSPAPGDLAGRREALARDIAAAMSGTSIQPE